MGTARDLELISYDGVVLDAREWLPDEDPAAWCLLVHGIGGEKTEDARYERLASRLAEHGRASLAFSFRGHGASEGSASSVTIASEMTDLLSAINYVRTRTSDYAIVAASFGAVSTLALLRSLSNQLPRRLVLWNPVLDLRDTFLEPTLPWGVETFGAENIRKAELTGTLQLASLGPLPYVLFAEMTRYQPWADFAQLDIPTLVAHGDADQTVSFEVAERVAASRASARMLRIEGAEHGFSRPDEDQILAASTLSFLLDE
ncbi:MAG: alpha/beta fold hydrolase [Ilumatobacteraceae bacterium]